MFKKSKKSITLLFGSVIGTKQYASFVCTVPNVVPLLGSWFLGLNPVYGCVGF